MNEELHTPEDAKRQLEEAIERYVKTINEPNDTLHGYILTVVTSNLEDLTRNWHSDVIRPAWQPFAYTMGLVEYQYRNFHLEDDE